MAVLYDQYQLANSTQIPRYAGSTIPELTKVADELQGRYDTGVKYSDLLEQVTDTATSSVFDRKELERLKQETRDKLKSYAQSGDYENTWRNVQVDARKFTNKFKAISQNQQLLSAQYEELDKKIATGKLTPAEADAEKRRIEDTYEGLKYDDRTGQYTNQFMGRELAANVDMPAKINKWLESSHAVERGWKVTRINGDYYQTNGGSRKLLPKSEVKKIVDSAIKLDPEVQAYLNQERELAPYKIPGYTRRLPGEKIMQVVQNNPILKQQVEAGVEQGYSPQEAFAQAIGNSRYEDILRQTDVYSGKGVIDEQTSLSDIAYTPIAVHRINKKADDEVLALTAQILQPDKALAFNPASLEKSIGDLRASTDRSQAGFSKWASEVGLSKKGDRFYDKEGNDISEQYRYKLDVVEQGARAAANLESYKKKAMAEAGYDESKLPEGVKAKAQKAYEETYAIKGSGAAGPGGGGFTTYDDATRKTNAQAAYDREISATPEYKKYKAKLEEYSKRAQYVGVTPFNSVSLNKKAEDLFKGLALNLDHDELDMGTLGMEWGAGTKTGEPLRAKDYKKVIDKAQFIGVGIDADGQYKFYYKVGDVENKGEQVIKMPAMSGTSEALISSGQMSAAKQYIGQSIAMLPGTGTVQISPTDEVKVDMQPNGEYELSFKMPGGNYIKTTAPNKAEAVNIIVNSQAQMLKRTNQK
jgi:hypothetical protein